MLRNPGCNSVLYSCVQAGNLHKALEVLRQMQGKRALDMH